MILGYLYFRKPPFLSPRSQCSGFASKKTWQVSRLPRDQHGWVFRAIAQIPVAMVDAASQLLPVDRWQPGISKPFVATLKTRETKILSGWWLGHPSEKYESHWKSIGMINMIIPNIWENKKWQPNHQPAIELVMNYFFYRLYMSLLYPLVTQAACNGLGRIHIQLWYMIGLHIGMWI